MSLKNPYKPGGMFEGADPIIFERAKQLRKNMTHAETLLWLHLRKGINGVKFRRQHPIGCYIADFYCNACRLIIELDGPIHNLSEVSTRDKAREQDLEAWGCHVIRFTNLQVISEPEKIIESITNKLDELIQLRKQNASSTKGV